MGRKRTLDWSPVGEVMQAALIRLAPGESVVGEAGAMLFAADGIELQAGIATGGPGGSVVKDLAGAIARKVAGESFFVTRFTNSAKAPAEVAFAAPHPGTILALEAGALPDGVIVQKHAFLCGSAGIEIGPVLQRNVLAGIFAGEGFVLQRISAPDRAAVALVHACGTVIERTLAAGESLRVDAGCVAAHEPSVALDVRAAGNLATMALGGHGPLLATLTGPGRAWVQTMPFPRLAGRIWDAAPQRAAFEAAAVAAARAAAQEAALDAVRKAVRPEARA